MLTSDHPLYPVYINSALEGSVIFPSDNEVDDNLYDYLCQINAVYLHLDHDYIDIEVGDMVMWLINQGQWQLCPLNTTKDDPYYDHCMGPLGFITKGCIKAIFEATVQFASNFICLPLWRHFNSLSPLLKIPRLTVRYSIDIFSSSTKWIFGRLVCSGIMWQEKSI